MREQIRLWFYSISFMSMTLVGKSPYRRVLTYEKLLDEHGREMHRSWGNAIAADEALDSMGADVMRWQFCEQNPGQNIKFGYGPAHEVKRRLLTLWNSVKFFVDYANVSPEGERGELEPLDRWLLSRAEQLVAEMTDAYERFWTPDVIASFESFVDDLSNWYIRRSRRRFWDGDAAALETLRTALLRSLVVIAPVMPFLAEHLWRVLRAGGRARVDLPRAAGPRPASATSSSWPRWPRRGGSSTSAARRARRRSCLCASRCAGSSSQGAELSRQHEDEIREELRVKEVEFGEVEATELRVKPNLPVLGPKLGKELGAVRAALEAGDFEQVNGGFRAAGHDLSEDEVLVERVGREGWAVAHGDGLTVALDTMLDAELEVERRVLDLIHELNAMRKEAGLELTDRIVVTLPAGRVRPPRARGLDQGRSAGSRDPHRRRQRRARDREGMKRCEWVPEGIPEYVAYHDEEWGVPSHDERHLFEMLTLEGAQAGLSWSTILRKREGYRKAFANFDAEKVARFGKRDVERLLADPGIVRNRLKVESTVNNAKRDPRARRASTTCLWGFVGGEPLVNRWRKLGDIPAETAESKAMSKDLKKRGFRFVGPTVCYAFMQACGLVNDHVVGCFRYREVT